MERVASGVCGPRRFGIAFAEGAAMRKSVLIIGVVLASACAPAVGECIGQAIGSAIGNSIVVTDRERDKDPARPDEGQVTSTSGYVSVPTTGGRLGVVFGEAPHTTAVPRSATDGGCDLQDFGWFLPNGWPDAGTLTQVSGQVTVTSSEPVDGGTHLVLDLTGLKMNDVDGGIRTITDRHVDIVAR